jgi:hypothetical protein
MSAPNSVTQVKTWELWTAFILDSRARALYHTFMAVFVLHPFSRDSLPTTAVQRVFVPPTLQKNHGNSGGYRLMPLIDSCPIVFAQDNVPNAGAQAAGLRPTRFSHLAPRHSTSPSKSSPVRFEPHLNYSRESRERRGIGRRGVKPRSTTLVARATEASSDHIVPLGIAHTCPDQRDRSRFPPGIQPASRHLNNSIRNDPQMRRSCAFGDRVASRSEAEGGSGAGHCASAL